MIFCFQWMTALLSASSRSSCLMIEFPTSGKSGLNFPTIISFPTRYDEVNEITGASIVNHPPTHILPFPDVTKSADITNFIYLIILYSYGKPTALTRFDEWTLLYQYISKTNTLVPNIYMVNVWSYDTVHFFCTIRSMCDGFIHCIYGYVFWGPINDKHNANMDLW